VDSAVASLSGAVQHVKEQEIPHIVINYKLKRPHGYSIYKRFLYYGKELFLKRLKKLTLSTIFSMAS
jgi:hypothetical protein